MLSYTYFFFIIIISKEGKFPNRSNKFECDENIILNLSSFAGEYIKLE